MVGQNYAATLETLGPYCGRIHNVRLERHLHLDEGAVVGVYPSRDCLLSFRLRLCCFVPVIP